MCVCVCVCVCDNECVCVYLYMNMCVNFSGYIAVFFFNQKSGIPRYMDLHMSFCFDSMDHVA